MTKTLYNIQAEIEDELENEFQKTTSGDLNAKRVKELLQAYALTLKILRKS